MNSFRKKIISVIFILGLLLTMVGCSSSTSSDPLTDTSMLFATISRIERVTPGGMGFTTEQAEQLLEIINPVLIGLPYTSDLAETMYEDVDKLLTKEQKKLIDDNMSNLGTQQGMGGGSYGGGAGMGNGTGTQGSSGGPGSGITPEGGSEINLFLRLDEIITENYLQ